MRINNYFPDVDGATTQGNLLEEGMETASDALGIQLAWNIENERFLPSPSEIKGIPIDSDRQFIPLISVDLSDYLQEEKPDKKTIKVPTG